MNYVASRSFQRTLVFPRQLAAAPLSLVQQCSTCMFCLEIRLRVLMHYNISLRSWSSDEGHFRCRPSKCLAGQKLFGTDRFCRVRKWFRGQSRYPQSMNILYRWADTLACEGPQKDSSAFKLYCICLNAASDIWWSKYSRSKTAILWRKVNRNCCSIWNVWDFPKLIRSINGTTIDMLSAVSSFQLPQVNADPIDFVHILLQKRMRVDSYVL